MIIIEGPDGAGKTTLINGLHTHWHGDSAWYDLQVIHSPGPLPVNLFEEGMRILEKVRPVSVLDRFPYFSESIYGMVLKRHPLVTIQEFIILRNRLMQFDPLLIFCRPPDDVLKESVLAEEQMEGVVDNLTKIIEGYDESFPHWCRDFRAVHYDFTDEDSGDRTVRAIKAYIKEKREGGWT